MEDENLHRAIVKHGLKSSIKAYFELFGTERTVEAIQKILFRLVEEGFRND